MSLAKLIATFCLITSFNLPGISLLANEPLDPIKEPVVCSIEDTSWITGTEADVMENLKIWYTQELVKEIWPKIEEFKRNENDWHAIYKVEKIKLVSVSNNKAIVKVNFLEIFPENLKTKLQGTYVLKKLEDKWKISSFDIIPGEKQNIDTL